MSKCINWPCGLPSGHEGKCSTATPEQFSDYEEIDERDTDDSPYCDCGAMWDDFEQASNRCGCCGKAIDP